MDFLEYKEKYLKKHVFSGNITLGCDFLMKEKKNILIFLVIYVSFLALIFANASFRASEIDSPLEKAEVLCISNGWSYESASENRDYSVAEFLKRYPMKQNEEYILKGTLPEAMTGAEVLYFYSQNLSLSVCIDGREIYALKEAKNKRIPGVVENIVPLPDNAAGKEITITYYSKGFFRYKPIDAVYLGDESEFVHSIYAGQLPLLMFALFCFMLAALQLLGSLLTQGSGSYKMHYLGWTMVLYSIWAFGASRFLDFFSNYQLNGQNIRHFVLALMAYPLFKFAILRYKEDKKLGFVGICLKGLTILNFPIVVALHFAGISPEESAVVTWFILGLVLCWMLKEQFADLKRQQRNCGKKKMSGILSFYAIALMLAGSCVDVIRYAFSYGEGRFYVSPACFLIMSLVLSSKGIKAVLHMLQLGRNTESVKQLAYFDILTQVYNRTALNEDMEKHEKTKKGKKNFGIVVFDVNNLKWVNDNLGHLAGDKLLQDAAAVIRDGFAEYGKTYRFGGDEFVVVMEEGAKERYSYGIHQMEQLLAKHNKKCKKDEEVSIAYGVAYYDGSDERTLWKIHEEADEHMYERKRKMKAQMNDGKDVRRD